MSDDDIVEKLERQYARTGLKYMLEAANEIERLRSALRATRNLLAEYDLRPRMADEDMARIAMVKEAADEALGE